MHVNNKNNEHELILPVSWLKYRKLTTKEIKKGK